jgi:hypothetical protein
MYSPTHSLTSALDGGEWSDSLTGHFTPRERNLGCGPNKMQKKKKGKREKCVLYIANIDDCDLFYDRNVLSSGRTPHDKTATALTTAKI